MQSALEPNVLGQLPSKLLNARLKPFKFVDTDVAVTSA